MNFPHEPLSEGRYPHRVECPNPHYWTSTDGDSAECEVSAMLAGIVRGLQPDVCIETGTGWGQTAYEIGRALMENKHGYLFTFENEIDHVIYAKKLCSGIPTVNIKEADARTVPWDGRSIDFAFFDSAYESRIPEFLRFRQWMHAGTFVAFHDTAPGHGILEDGLDLLTHVHNLSRLSLIDLPTPRGLTIGVVL